jgi:hypothetical protein
MPATRRTEYSTTNINHDSALAPTVRFLAISVGKIKNVKTPIIAPTIENITGKFLNIEPILTDFISYVAISYSFLLFRQKAFSLAFTILLLDPSVSPPRKC